MTATDHSNSVLPVMQVADEVVTSLIKSNVVLQAEPGAGKSTGLPLVLLKAGLTGKILMLEPRRLAAVNVASRLASQLGEPLGQSIGLRMRGHTAVSKNTRLEVVTEGVLTRILQSDPMLDDVSVVIFDEFHERSLSADIGLALCLDVQREVRDDLRLLLMSATLDGDGLCNHLGLAKPINCEVRQHPVEIIWRSPGRLPLWQSVASVVPAALAAHDGDVLVFLPGVAEIEKTARQLQGSLPTNTTLHKLHRGVSAKAQTAATEANTRTNSHRRVILSTSIAETSLTIDGVSIVIDSGVERRPKIDPASGIERLETVMASKASAKQRAGRAGRTRPGVCYRLWVEESHAARAASWQPEIQRADLSSLLLELGQWGVQDVSALPWLDAPPQRSIERARSLLEKLGIWADDGLTAHGRAIAGLSVEPRIGNMLVWAASHGVTRQAAALAALLEETPRHSSADITLLLQRLSASHKRRAQTLAEKTKDTVAPVVLDPALLLLRAYPDRIARRRSGGPSSHDVRYQLSGGAGAILHEEDPLSQHEYLVAADLGGRDKEARIYSALPIDLSLLLEWCEDLVETKDVVHWDDKAERVVAEQQQCLGALVLSSRGITNISADLRAEALISGIKKNGVNCFSWTDDAREWQARVMRMRALNDRDGGSKGSDSGYPAVDDESLLASLDGWLLPYLNDVTSLKALRQLDLLSLLNSMLSYSQLQHLDEWLPKKIQVPSGAMHKLRYTDDGNPVLSVKLQEMFGCRENPSVAKGRVPLKVELLSPARRPVQVTEDLGNFWHNSYPAVKKDLAGRYPKHPWPDDPLSAEATAYAKPRKRK